MYGIRSKLALSLIFISGLLFYCYEFYLRILPGAYADQIMTFFKSGPFEYSFLVSSYNITYLAMQIPAGLLLDRFGNRRVLVAAVLLCGIGNAVFVFDSYNISIVGRLLVGLGSSFAFVGVLKLCREYLSARYFAFLASIVISVGTLAAAYAQQISTIVSSSIDWREVFVWSGGASLIIAMVIWFALGKTQKRLAKQETLPDLKTSISQAAALLKNRGIWLTALVGGLLYVPTVVLTAQWGVYFFEHEYGLTQEVSARAITIILLGWVVFSPIVGFLADRFAKEKALILILSLISGSLLF
ncbi:MFS transporter [Francisellaceae bacterium]|nr:MFS transporter [Francisellaceae bacterium]